MMTILDTFARPLRSLRISVTDRCNLRCEYCMPEEHYVWLPRKEILDFEEIARLVEVFADLGVEEVHLTGGEPLMRRDLSRLVALLAASGVKDVALTTNAVLLAEQAEALREAGLRRITISLDTLRHDRFIQFTRRDMLHRVLAGVEAAGRLGFSPVKINTVVMRGRNEDEICDLLEFGKRTGSEVRFIEYMDVGGATRWSPDRVFGKREMLEAISQRSGPLTPAATDPSAPASRYALSDGTTFGIIASTTQPFCRACDRSRLTADGTWLLCLYATSGLDLRGPLRAGASPEELKQLIASAWQRRADRGAEERLKLRERGAFATPEMLRQDPHLEMHTRGG
jgi:cyclic pyranopterin phosphate synthase